MDEPLPTMDPKEDSSTSPIQSPPEEQPGEDQGPAPAETPFEDKAAREQPIMKKQKKTYETSAEKKRDFMIGMAIFFGLNILIFLFLRVVTFGVNRIDPDFSFIMVILTYILPFLINLGFIVFFFLTRKWIALGMLGTFAVLLVITLVLGVIVGAMCLLLFQH